MSPRHVGAGNLTGALWKRTLKRRTTSSPRKKYCSPTSPTRKTISALLESSKHPLKSSTRSAHRYALSPPSSHSYAKDATPARRSCCGALRGFSWVKVSDPQNTMTQHIDIAGLRVCGWKPSSLLLQDLLRKHQNEIFFFLQIWKVKEFKYVTP